MKNTLRLLLIFTLFNIYSFAQSQPYVILISFDGFRWDYPSRGLSPNLDLMKQEGVSALSFKPCFPSKTFPNHLAIITGLYPAHHGIIENHFEDQFTNESYKISDTLAVRDPKWYRGEAFWETAKRQGIITASYFWPGSELTADYRRPDYYKNYEHTKPYSDRVNGVIQWLNLPYSERPHFITMYFDATDSYGHKYGPDSPQVDSAIQILDIQLGDLFAKLKEINLFDSTDIIVVSDHGMTEINSDRIINVDDFFNGINYKVDNSGVIMSFDKDENNLDEIYDRLNSSDEHFSVYFKKDIPAFYHFSDSYLVGDLVAIADVGWTFRDKKRNQTKNILKAAITASIIIILTCMAFSLRLDLHLKKITEQVLLKILTCIRCSVKFLILCLPLILMADLKRLDLS
ncbi:MAG: alkaline phosphatase family protein [Ignavibacteriales bacterium]|nr:alkaline phosphatase family protein [Ignavibacteriales bacterium]